METLESTTCNRQSCAFHAVSPHASLVSPPDLAGSKTISVSDDEHVRELLVKYPAAITDFHGCGPLCVYKTGPVWPVAGPYSQKLTRAARPIYHHGIAPIWVATVWSIVAKLDSLQLEWNTVDPLAYANRGQAQLICDFVISISVKPRSLPYEAAVAAASAVEVILEAAGFPEIQVAFVESIYRPHGKLMGFNPTYALEGIPGLCKPFTPTLGLAIAPDKTTYYKGTGGLFFHIDTNGFNKRTVLLTCAHVARPPPLFGHEAYTRMFESQPREDIILLGSGSSDASVEAIKQFISEKSRAITSWERPLSRIPAPTENEPADVTAKRNGLTNLIARAKNAMKAADNLHTQVTKNFSTAASRILGSVLHSSNIEVGSDGYKHDWAFIQIDDDKLEMKDFKGNKLFVGGNKNAVDWWKYMFAQPHDHSDFHVPEDLLLQIKDYVREAEFRDPPNYDIHNVKALLAVKNGCTTGTTYGRVNGLQSITRHYREDGIEVKALEFIVCGYDNETSGKAQFSDSGDSGSAVVGRDGRIIGLLTGGGGRTGETDKSYITPFYALKKEIEKKYPEAYLFPADA